MADPPLGKTGFPSGIQLGRVALGLEANAYALRCAAFDDVLLAIANRIVTTTNMKVGAYTIANASMADGFARNVTVTGTQVGGVDDTLGTLVIVGTDLENKVITETLTPINGSVVAGAKAFKTVTSVTGVGWVINTGNDTLVVGFGGILGLPFKLRAAADVVLATLATGIVAATVVAGGDGVGDSIATSTVDCSAGTYDGAKDLRVFARA